MDLYLDEAFFESLDPEIQTILMQVNEMPRPDRIVKTHASYQSDRFVDHCMKCQLYGYYDDMYIKDWSKTLKDVAIELQSMELSSTKKIPNAEQMWDWVCSARAGTSEQYEKRLKWLIAYTQPDYTKIKPVKLDPQKAFEQFKEFALEFFKHVENFEFTNREEIIPYMKEMLVNEYI